MKAALIVERAHKQVTDVDIVINTSNKQSQDTNSMYS